MKNYFEKLEAYLEQGMDIDEAHEKIIEEEYQKPPQEAFER